MYKSYKKIETFEHSYKWEGRLESKCKIDIYSNDKNSFVVVFTDLNEGMSVTNSAEQLAQEVKSLKSLPNDGVLWVEKYKGVDYYEAVSFHYNDMADEFSNPEWSRINNIELLTLLIKNEKDEKQK